MSNCGGEFDSLVNSLLRPTEECSLCTEFRYFRKNEKRRRILAIVLDIETKTHACILLLKRKGPTTLGIRHVLPIHKNFKISLAQTKPPRANTPGTPKKAPEQLRYFILRIQDKDYELRLETESLETVQNVCGSIKKLTETADEINSDIFKDFTEYYGNLSKLSNDENQQEYEDDDVSPSSKSIRDRNQNPFIMFDSDVCPKDFKAIKNGWIAKELRVREQQFSSFFDLKVHIGTWNVNGRPPTESLDPWIHAVDISKTDVLVLGFQEVDLSTEAFIRGGVSIKEEDWCFAIEACLAKSKALFKKVGSKQLVGMLILVYVHEKHLDQLSDVTACSVGCGILGVMGNKGAVAVRMRLYDSYFTFINCHLAADVNQVDRRNQDFLEICARSNFPLGSDYDDFTDYTLQNPWVTTHMDIGWNIHPETNNNQNAAPQSPTTLDSPTGLSSESGGDLMMRSSIMKNTCTIFDSDHLFWMGDLNYRVPLPDNEAKAILKEENGIQKLLALDQLNTEIRCGRAFYDFQEQPITFVPTFKYDVGTNTFDTSEKRRAPSFCDRILWLKNPIHKEDQKSDNGKDTEKAWVIPEYYQGIMDLKMSDHKAVLGVYALKCRKLNQEQKAKVYDQIVLDLDRFENDALPDLQLNKNQLEFGQVKYFDHVTRSVVLENTGQVLAKYQFISTQEGQPYCKPWCTVNPPFGMLLPGEKIKINITIHVNADAAPALNFDKDALNDILILHTKNGKDLFISITGTWLVSSFGNDLEVLCRLQKPVRELSSADCHQLRNAVIVHNDGSQVISSSPSLTQDSIGENKQINLNSSSVLDLSKKLSVPKEIWRLVDFIYRYGMDVEDIFFGKGDTDIMEYIRECLDTAKEFDLVALIEDKNIPLYEEDSASYDSLTGEEPTPLSKQPSALPLEEIELDIDLLLKSRKDYGGNVLNAPKKVSEKSRVVVVHSMVEILFHLLESLVDPVVPFHLHHKCVQEGYHTFAAGLQVLSEFPETHHHLFIYLVSFFREFLQTYAGPVAVDVEKLAYVLAPLLLVSPTAHYHTKHMSSSGIVGYNNDKGMSNSGFTTDTSRLNISGQQQQLKYATVSGGKLSQPTSSSLMPQTNETVLILFQSSPQQAPNPSKNKVISEMKKKEKSQYELRRRMFLMQFLEASNDLTATS